MNRREATRTIGLAALATTLGRWTVSALPQDGKDSEPPASLPRSVVGVRIVDSKLASEATDLSRTSSPPYLFNHCMRTYLFGSLVGKAVGHKFDEETLYIACMLHDLGLTDSYMGDLPFEIQGAEAAKKFLLGHGMNADRAEIVWDGIAMHCLAICQYKRPEIAMVGEGVGVEILGPDPAQISQSQIDQVLAAFPRLGFKKQFTKSCADAIRRHPRTAGRTFMRDIAERNLPDYKPRNFCDAMEQAPFKE
jgi:hypothetical protein